MSAFGQDEGGWGDAMTTHHVVGADAPTLTIDAQLDIGGIDLHTEESTMSDLDQTTTKSAHSWRDGLHPINVGHLVMGVAFAGLTIIWALHRVRRRVGVRPALAAADPLGGRRRGRPGRDRAPAAWVSRLIAVVREWLHAAAAPRVTGVPARPRRIPSCWPRRSTPR